MSSTEEDKASKGSVVGANLRGGVLRAKSEDETASPPAIVDASPGCFARFLFERRVVCITLRAASVVSGRVIGVERRAVE